ncbi:hypothetical protein OG562_10905 [Streptomyces sp. NBC_01275]|uniref:hypothetical protein n=1 Tax=Streptomyces sp. NBC_01275 TaxID=2903807 RepID=UPI002254D611|nr:hypothetical protein [Streptomyces sp. NBC_01275]MCX4761480.1 hypothetical protein [Streptomyces sp. NBC_01275]
MLALQRAAGNTAVARAVSARRAASVQQAAPAQRAASVQRAPAVQQDASVRQDGQAWAGAAHYAERPVEHPEWPQFQLLMRQAGFDGDTVEAVWQLLIGGMRQQEQVENALSAAGGAPSGRSERRAQRAGNDWYRAVIDMVGDHLRIDTPTMGLWSGGLDVNDYASAKGHTTLEHSNLGRVINSLRLHPNFSLIGPLWNLLSVAFVQRATGPVHVFIRAHDPDSVLQDQEIPQLRVLQSMDERAGRQISLVWHPLYTTADGEIREISPDLKLVDDAPYRQRDLCIAALYTYLLRMHDSGNPHSARAYDEMHNRLKQNGLDT